ncbi:ComF family protein [Chloroflexota bacterium]
MVGLLPQVAKFKGVVLNLLFPQRCIGCGKEGDFICYSCQASLPRIIPPLCPRCGRPQPSGMLCSSCVSWRAEIDGIRSPFRFEGVMRQAIHWLKYRNLRALATPLAQLLNDYLTTNPVPGDVMVPVPLHRKRLRERGYNQSSLLARELSRLNNLAVADDCLVRQRHALPQARASNVDERQRNVAGAFACCDYRLRGKQVILIDDVSTSGVTLDACASALKAAGATSVWGLVLAREI